MSILYLELDNVVPTNELYTYKWLKLTTKYTGDYVNSLIAAVRSSDFGCHL